MSDKVIIIGAGGHGKVIADIVISNGNTVKGFLDDRDDVQGGTVLGFPVLGKLADYKKYSDCEFVIAVGNPQIRKNIAESMEVKWHTAIHPRASVSQLGTSLGEGTVVMANAVINPCAKTGKHCIINTGAVVEHDNVLGDYVHISPNATLAGTVTVGDSTHIGAGACVKNNISITAGCTVGAGSVVVRDITQSGIYIGVPARRKVE